MSREKGSVNIYYVSSDGLCWGNYLQSKLNEKEYNIFSTLVEINNIHDDYISSDVHVLLVSPDVCSLSLKALDTLQTHHSLAVLLGVEHSEYQQIVSEEDLHNLCKWQLFKTQANEHSVRGLLMKIIELYEDAHKDDVELDDPYDFLPEPKPILPPRVVSKQVQDAAEEEYDVIGNTCLQRSSKHETEDDDALSENSVSNKLHSILIPQTSTERCVFLLLDKKPDGNVKIITENNEEIEAVRVRKKLYQVSLKDDDIRFQVVEGGHVLGNSAININTEKLDNSSTSTTNLSSQTTASETSDLDKIRDLLMKQTDPVCMLCRAFRLKEETMEALDDFLAQRCQHLQNLRSLQKVFTIDEQNITGSSSTDQWPTLLHFGAEFNLIKFCKELLNLPRSLELCNIMNSEKEIPFDIAQHKNHTELATMLEQYMEQQWRSNDPGNKDSGIEPDTPLPHGSVYMAMDSEIMPTAHEKPPVPHRESTYMKMGGSLVDIDAGINEDDLFEDDIPIEPPTPHIKNYVNLHKKEAKTNEIPDICVTDYKEVVDQQKRMKEKREMQMQKSHSESDTSDFDLSEIEKMAKLGYDVNKIYRACNPTGTRSASEGSEPHNVHKSQSFSSTHDFESGQNTKQAAPRKSSLIKKFGGLFHRKHSLSEQGGIIPEEKTKKRDKKKGKSKHYDYTDSSRVSDISTSSTESSTSTDNNLLFPIQAPAEGQDNMEEIYDNEKTSLRKQKIQKHPMRRKSKRLAHAEKDQLRVLDLPNKRQEQLQDF